MEQSVARRAHNPKVTGSSPVPATKCRNADIAQSVERILGKDKVTSSILVISSIYKQGFLWKREAFLLYWPRGIILHIVALKEMAHMLNYGVEITRLPISQVA